MSNDNSLQILVDVRSRLEDLVKTQTEIRRLREEARSTSEVLKTGFIFEVGRKGLDLLTSSLQESVFEAFRMADAIEDGARNLEISQRAYQVLGAVIKDAGGDMGLLQMAVSQSNRAMTEARDNSSAAAVAYRQLGLDARELESVPVERRFELIGRAVAKATDKTAAYSSASAILGSRNLPTLLGALKDLAEDGYGNLEAKMISAGRVMNDETIGTLSRAKKQVENFQSTTLPIAAGTAIGWADSLMQTLGAAAANLVNLMQGLDVSELNNSGYKPPGKGVTPDTTPLQQTPAWQADTLTVLKAQNAQSLIERDITTSEIEKKAALVPLLWAEIHARSDLLELANAAPVTATFTQENKDLLIEKLRAELAEIKQKKGNLQYEPNAMQRRVNDHAWGAPEDYRENKNFLSMGEGIGAGAGDWVTNLGSRGEQVAESLQSTLGQVVSGISDGISGWITGTQSFGASMQQLGGTIFKTFLNSIIQMGVQWLVTQSLMMIGMNTLERLGDVHRAGRVVKENAAEAATLPAKTAGAAATGISSWGSALIFGVLAIAMIAALSSGFMNGGYTGNGGTSEIAGVVHGQEHVMTAATTRRLGPAFFDRLNAGASPGTAVASSPVAFGGTGFAGAGSRESIRNNHFWFDKNLFLDAVREDLTAHAHEVYDQRSRS